MLRYFKSDDSPTPVDELITKVLHEMRNSDLMSEEYVQLLSRLERLYELKGNEKPKPISRDTMLIVAGNLAGILLIVAYEQKHVITSKSLGHVMRVK